MNPQIKDELKNLASDIGILGLLILIFGLLLFLITMIETPPTQEKNHDAHTYEHSANQR